MSEESPLWLYSGRVGHDVSEGFCSCGGYHDPDDGIEVGTKTVLLASGEVLVMGEDSTTGAL